MKKIFLVGLFLASFLVSLINPIWAACPNPQDEIETAIGCINVNAPESFVQSVFTLALGIGGGIAFLLIIFGALQILLSSGNPEKVQGGKETITSAIAGLLLIIFSVFILRLIAVEVLKIPEFTGP